MKLRHLAFASMLLLAGGAASADSFQVDTDGAFDFALGTYGSASTFNLAVNYDLFDGNLGIFGYADTPSLQTLQLGALQATPATALTVATTNPTAGFLHHYTYVFSGVGSGTYGLSLFGANGGSDKTTFLTNFSATVTAVPEPQTYALMLAGLGAVGFMARRRKKP